MCESCKERRSPQTAKPSRCLPVFLQCCELEKWGVDFLLLPMVYKCQRDLPGVELVVDNVVVDQQVGGLVVDVS